MITMVINQTKTETTNMEKMTTRQLIHNFYHQLRIKRRQSTHGEKIFITKFMDIPKQVTTNHELQENKEEKQQYIKEYIIKKYYFKTYPCSIEILDYVVEKTEYGLYDILHIHYIISPGCKRV